MGDKNKPSSDKDQKEERSKARRSCGQIGSKGVEPLLQILEELLKSPSDKFEIRTEYDKLEKKFEEYEKSAEELTMLETDDKHKTITDVKARKVRMEEITNQVREILRDTPLAPDVTRDDASPEAGPVTGGQRSNLTSDISGRDSHSRPTAVTTDREAYVEEQLAKLELEQLEERQELEIKLADLAYKLAKMKLKHAKALADRKVQLWQEQMKEP